MAAGGMCVQVQLGDPTRRRRATLPAPRQCQRQQP